jgi:predicted acyl esterase
MVAQTPRNDAGSRERDMRNWIRGALAGVSAAAVVAASGLTLAYAQNSPKSSPQAAAPAPAVRGGRPVKVAEGAVEVIAPMRDGVKLAGNLYKPAGNGPFPCIVQRTPYGKDAMFANPAQMKKYTDAGYAYLVQDVRGKGRSEGFYQAFINDAFDGYDTIEWMAKQPWCNGKIGIMGASAMGYTTMLAATMAPPHLKAAFSIVTPSNRLTGSYIGGAFKQKDSGDWSRGQGIPEEVIAFNANNYADSSYWARTDIGDQRKYINIPIYSLGGWYDIFNEGNVRNFMLLQHEGAKGARGNQKLEMGPFGHGALSGDMDYPDGGSLAGSPNEMRWWDYWLKGVDNGIMSEPPVKAYMMAGARKGNVSSKNRWMYFGDWPPAPAVTTYYFHSDGSLSTRPPGEKDAAKTYSFDPKNPVQTIGGANLTFARGPMDQRPIGNRPDYLRFQTPVLDKDVTVAGEIFANLWAATDGPDTDFMVKLVDVYPDGYEAIVLDTALRTRYRNGRMPDEIKMMTPGAPEKLKLDLWDTMITFEKGHRIQVAVTSSNAPRLDVNPNTGENPGPAAHPRVARNTVFMDASKPSSIDLPILVQPQ